MAAQHFYVTKTGNDANDGSSWADGDAWLTIQHAADNANPAGGTPVYIHIAAGTYAEQVDIDTYAGTDDDNRIIYDGDVENESGDGASRPIGDGELTRNTMFYNTTKSWITVRDVEAINCNVWGIVMLAPEGIIIERCLIHDNPRIGISTFCTGSGDAGGHIVRNNIVYDCCTAETASTDAGIQVVNWGNNIKVYSNTVFSCDVDGIHIYHSTAGREGSADVKNNICHDNKVNQIYVATGWTVTTDYNNWYKDGGTRCGHWKGTDCAALSDWQTASSQDANSQNTDPKYVNEAGKDFHITDNTSPCYQNGTDLSGTFTDDYDKDTRVHWDIGADYIPAPPVVEKDFAMFMNI